MFPSALAGLISEDYLVRAIEAYVTRLDLHALGFSKAEPIKNGRPGHDPAHLFFPPAGSRVPA